MIIFQISINSLLFFIGFVGVITNYKSILITLMGLELMLLSSSLNFIFFSIYLNDMYGQIFSIFILTLAACEAAIGLAVLIVSFKNLGRIKIDSEEEKR
jgi:NADH-quinone oxidoreductase subunit K